MKFPRRGLYAVTLTEGKTNDRIAADVLSAIKGGASVVQYRDKCKAAGDDSLAVRLLEICHRHGIPMIVNDDIELAERIGADGVHLGKDDRDIENARNTLGSAAIVGVSCYDSLETALEAQRKTATYVAFGRFFPSISKPLASPARLETLKQAKKSLKIPIVAIGGIAPENGKVLLDAGADLLAVIGGLFSQNPELSARAFSDLFNRV
ncbi:MAG: thiamine phosphate synthase [Gammaproteobacteria bacterium]